MRRALALVPMDESGAHSPQGLPGGTTAHWSTRWIPFGPRETGYGPVVRASPKGMADPVTWAHLPQPSAIQPFLSPWVWAVCRPPSQPSAPKANGSVFIPGGPLPRSARGPVSDGAAQPSGPSPLPKLPVPSPQSPDPCNGLPALLLCPPYHLLSPKHPYWPPSVWSFSAVWCWRRFIHPPESNQRRPPRASFVVSLFLSFFFSWSHSSSCPPTTFPSEGSTRLGFPFPLVH